MTNGCTPEVVLIDESEVRRKYGGISKRTVWVWVKQGLIPQPHVQRIRYTRWLKSDIDASILAMKQEQRREAST